MKLRSRCVSVLAILAGAAFATLAMIGPAAAAGKSLDYVALGDSTAPLPGFCRSTPKPRSSACARLLTIRMFWLQSWAPS